MLTTKVLRIFTHRFRWTAVLPLLALFSPLSFSKSKIVLPTDSDYVFALGAANDFLHAWQTQDREAGFLLLTDRLKQRSSEDALVDFFFEGVPGSELRDCAREKAGSGTLPVSGLALPAPREGKGEVDPPADVEPDGGENGVSERSIDRLP